MATDCGSNEVRDFFAQHAFYPQLSAWAIEHFSSMEDLWNDLVRCERGIEEVLYVATRPGLLSDDELAFIAHGPIYWGDAACRCPGPRTEQDRKLQASQDAQTAFMLGDISCDQFYARLVSLWAPSGEYASMAAAVWRLCLAALAFLDSFEDGLGKTWAKNCRQSLGRELQDTPNPFARSAPEESTALPPQDAAPRHHEEAPPPVPPTPWRYLINGQSIDPSVQPFAAFFALGRYAVVLRGKGRVRNAEREFLYLGDDNVYRPGRCRDCADLLRVSQAWIDRLERDEADGGSREILESNEESPESFADFSRHMRRLGHEPENIGGNSLCVPASWALADILGYAGDHMAGTKWQIDHIRHCPDREGFVHALLSPKEN